MSEDKDSGTPEKIDIKGISSEELEEITDTILNSLPKTSDAKKALEERNNFVERVKKGSGKKERH